MPIYCPKCGTQNLDWAQTCQQCSAPLPQRPPGGQVYGETPQQSPAQPQAPYQQQPSPWGAPYSGYQQPGVGAAPANYARIGKRLVAHILDSLLGGVGALPGIIVIFIGVGLAGATSGSRGEPDAASMMFIFLGYGLVFIGALAVWLYNTYLLGRDGASLGKRWMGITVLDPNGQPLGFGKAFLRELVKAVLGNVCLILLLWPLWDNEKQGLYDKLFSTHVYEA